MSTERLPDDLSTYDTICSRDYNKTRIHLVGEHHSSAASERLVSRALRTADPALVAVESCPSQQALCADGDRNVSRGIDAGIQYAREHDLPIGLIDRSQMDLITEFPFCPPEPIPFEPPEPDSTGDIPADAVAEYRERIQTECPRRYDLLLLQRERCMAEYLATLAVTADGPLVTILGASHLHAVASRLETDVRPRDVPDERLRSPAQKQDNG